MRFFILLVLFIFSVAFMAVSFFYVIARLIGSKVFDTGSGAWKTLIEKLRTLTNVAVHDWDSESLGTLSYNIAQEKKTKGMNPIHTGVFTAVFQEPMMSFAKQGRNNALVAVAKTSGREFIFRNKGKETEIWVNNAPLGTYIDGVLLSAGKTSKLLAKIEIDADSRQFPLYIGDKMAASVNNLAKTITPFPRVLIPLATLNEEEETVVLAIAALIMLKMQPV